MLLFISFVELFFITDKVDFTVVGMINNTSTTHVNSTYKTLANNSPN